MPGDPTQPILHLLALGVGVGGNANFRFGVGVMQILAFLDTNILVYPTRGPNVNGFAPSLFILGFWG